MGFSMDIKDYTEPERETERVPHQVTASMIERGDQMGARTVTGVKVGTKWVHVVYSSGGGHKIERYTEIEVMRERLTRAYLDAVRHHDRIENVLKFYRESDPQADRLNAISQLDKRTREWNGVRYNDICDVLEVDAKSHLDARFLHAIEWASESEKFDGDPADLLEKFIADLKEELAAPHSYRALSRSTNMMSNLVEDVAREQKLKWIDNTRWW